MKTLEDFTPEIKAKIPEYLAKSRNFYKGDLPFNREASVEYIHYVCELADEGKPPVYFAENPSHFKELWSVLKRKYDKKSEFKGMNETEIPLTDEIKDEIKQKIDRSESLWLVSPYARCYLTYYQFIAQEFDLGYEKDDKGVMLRDKLNKLYNLVIESSVQRAYFCDDYILVLKNTQFLNFVDNKLHNDEGPALVYDDWTDPETGRFHPGNKLYFWKGTKVPEKLIMAPETMTREDLKDTDNAEVRRCYIEAMGVSLFYDIMSDGKGLKLLDEDTDDQGYPMKLYEFDFHGQTTQMLEVTDPSTGRVYNLAPPSQNCANVWAAKADTFDNEKLTFRQGDVGLVEEGSNHEKPLIET